MKPYCEMNRQELLELKESLKAEYNDYQKRKLSLNMARGKPSQEQLNLSMGMMDVLSSDSDLTCEDGTDCRNYGVLDGIEEAKELMADMMEVRPDQVIIYGNSSLNVMYDTVARVHDQRRYGLYPLVQAGQGEVSLPRSRLRPALRHHPVFRH